MTDLEMIANYIRSNKNVTLDRIATRFFHLTKQQILDVLDVLDPNTVPTIMRVLKYIELHKEVSKSDLIDKFTSNDVDRYALNEIIQSLVIMRSVERKYTTSSTLIIVATSKQ